MAYEIQAGGGSCTAIQGCSSTVHIQIQVQAAILGSPALVFMGNCSKGCALLCACRKGRLAGAELRDMARRLTGVWLLPASLAAQAALHWGLQGAGETQECGVPSPHPARPTEPHRSCFHPPAGCPWLRCLRADGCSLEQTSPVKSWFSPSQFPEKLREFSELFLSSRRHHLLTLPKCRVAGMWVMQELPSH